MSWKKFGGLNQYEKSQAIHVKDVVAKNITFQDTYVGDFTITNGTLTVDDTDKVGIVCIQNILAGGDISCSGNLTVQTGNMEVANGMATFQGDVLMNQNATIMKKLFFEDEQNTFLIGNDTGVGINVANPEAILDICGNFSQVLRVKSTKNYTRNVMTENRLGYGIVFRVDSSFASMDFFHAGIQNISGNQVNPEATIKYDPCGELLFSMGEQIHIQSKKVFISSRNENNVINPENATLLVQDHESPSNIFLPQIFQDKKTSTGTAAHFLSHDICSNTFISITTAADDSGKMYGWQWGGGIDADHSGRDFGTTGWTDDISTNYYPNAKRYIPAQNYVSGSSTVKSRATTGLNTYRPKVDEKILDVNGPVSINHEEIHCTALFPVESAAASFDGSFGVIVSYPYLIVDVGVPMLYHQAYVTYDGGKTWTIQSDLSVQTQNDYNRYCVYAYDNTFVISIIDEMFVGADFTSFSVDRGKVTETVIIDPSASSFYSSYDSNIYLTKFEDKIPQIVKGGFSNTITASATDHNGSFFFINKTEIFAVVGSNSIVNHLNGGITYKSMFVKNNVILAVGTPSSSSTMNITYIKNYSYENFPNLSSVNKSTNTSKSETLNDAFIIDNSCSIVVGNSGVIYISDDGMNSWTRVTEQMIGGMGNSSLLLDASVNIIKVHLQDQSYNTFLFICNNSGKSYACYAYFPGLFRYENAPTMLDVDGHVEIGGNVNIRRNVIIGKNLDVSINVNIGNDTTIGHDLRVGGNSDICGNVRIDGSVGIGGNTDISGHCFVDGGAMIGGDVSMGMNAYIKKNITMEGTTIASTNSRLSLFENAVADVSFVTSATKIRIGAEGSGNITYINHNLRILGDNLHLGDQDKPFVTHYKYSERRIRYIDNGGRDYYEFRGNYNYVFPPGTKIYSDFRNFSGEQYLTDISLSTIEGTSQSSFYVNNKTDVLSVELQDYRSGSGYFIKGNRDLSRVDESCNLQDLSDANINNGFFKISRYKKNDTDQSQYEAFLAESRYTPNIYPYPEDSYSIRATGSINVVRLNLSGLQFNNFGKTYDGSASIIMLRRLQSGTNLNPEDDFEIVSSNVLWIDNEVNNYSIKMQNESTSPLLSFHHSGGLGGQAFNPTTVSGDNAIFSYGAPFNIFVKNDNGYKNGIRFDSSSCLLSANNAYLKLNPIGVTISGRTEVLGVLYVDKDASFNGKVDISGATVLRNTLLVGGDVSLNRKLFVAGDVSFSSGLVVGGDVSLNSRLIVLKDVSFSSGLVVGGDVSLNSRLIVLKDVSFSSGLVVGGDVSFNSRLIVSKDVSFSSGLVVGGDVSFNSRLIVRKDVSFSSGLVVGGDVSLNGRLIVLKDVSFSSGLVVGGDVSLNSRLIVSKDVSFSSGLKVGGNASFNGSLEVSIPNPNRTSITASFGGRDGYIRFACDLSASSFNTCVDHSDNVIYSLYPKNLVLTTHNTSSTFTTTPCGIKIKTSSLQFYGESEFNNGLTVGGDVSLNSRLIVSKDVSFSSGLVVGGDVSLNSRLIVGKDVSFNRSLTVGGDVSFNSKLSVGGDVVLDSNLYLPGSHLYLDGTLVTITASQLNYLSAQTNQLGALENAQTIVYAENPTQNVFLKSKLSVVGDASFSSGLVVGGDVSFNSRLIVRKDVSFSSGLVVGGDVSLNSRLIVSKDVSFSTGLVVGGDVSFNSRLIVSKDVSFSSGLVVGGDVSLNSRLIVSKDVSFSSGLVVGGDVSLNSRLIVSKDVSFSSGLVVGGDVSLNSRLIVSKDVSFSSGLVVGGDVSLNSRLIVSKDVSFSSGLVVGGDVSFNSRLIVSKDVSFSSGLVVGGDVSLNSRLIVSKDVSFSSGLVVGGDVSFNSRLIVSKDVSFSSGLVVSGDVSLNSRLIVSKDVSFSSGLVVGGDVSLNSRLMVLRDVSFSSGLVVGGDVSFNSRLIVSKDVSFSSGLAVGGDVSFNSRLIVSKDVSFSSGLVVGGDVSLNSRLIVSKDVSFSSGLVVGGDVSLNSRLIVSKDVSFSSGLVVGGDVSFNSRLIVSKDVSFSSGLVVSGDVSLNSRLIVSKDVSFSSGLVVGGDVSFNSRLIVLRDVSFSSGLVVGGDVSFNSRLIVSKDVSFSSGLVVGGDVSFNSRLIVSKDVSFSSGLVVGGDVSLNSRLIVSKDVSFSSGLVVGGDVSFNSRLIVSKDVSFSSGLVVSGDVSLNSRLIVSKDVSFSSGLVVGGDVSLNSRLMVLRDVSFSSGLVVGGDVSFNSRLIVSKDVSFSSGLAVGGDVSFNSRLIVSKDVSFSSGLVVGGDVSLNSRLIVSKDVSFSSGLVVGGDVSLNSRLIVSKDVSFSSGLVVGGDVSFNSRLIVSKDVSFSSGLVVSGDVSLNSRLIVSKDVSFSSGLVVGGDVSFNSRLIVSKNVSFSSGLVVGGDVSLNSRLMVLRDASFSSGLVVGGDVSLNSRLIVLRDASFSSGLVVGGDVSFNSRLMVLRDVSFSSGLVVGGDVSFNSRLIVSKDVSFSSGLVVGGDVSFNSRLMVLRDVSFSSGLKVGGDVSFNSRLIVSKDVSFSSGLVVGGDVSFNSRLNVVGDVSFSSGLKVGGNASFNGSLVVSIPNVNGTSLTASFVGKSGTISFLCDADQSAYNTCVTTSDNVIFSVYPRNLVLTTHNTSSNYDTTPCGIKIKTTSLQFYGQSEFNNGLTVGGDVSLNSQLKVGGYATFTRGVIQTLSAGLDICPALTIKNSGTIHPYKNISFFTHLGGGSYNGVTVSGDSGIVAGIGGYALGTTGLVLTTHGGTCGIRITQTKVEITATTININGTFNAGTCNATSFNANSDYRLKENIKKLVDCCSVDNLNPVSYVLKNNKEHHIGFLAHELQEYFPTAVSGQKDGETMQTVNYIELIPVLVKEIQNLKKEIKCLKNDIEYLKGL